MLYTPVFIITIVQITMIVLLATPVPPTQRLAIVKKGMQVTASFSPVIICGAVYMLILLGDSVLSYYKTLGRLNDAVDTVNPEREHYLKMKIFEAERNMHLVFFAFFLQFVLWRSCVNVQALVDVETMKKQSDNANATLQELSDKAKENERVAEEKKQLEKALAEARLDRDTIKKQNEGTQKEYMSMIDQLAVMQNKLDELQSGPSMSKKDK